MRNWRKTYCGVTTNGPTDELADDPVIRRADMGI